MIKPPHPPFSKGGMGDYSLRKRDYAASPPQRWSQDHDRGIYGHPHLTIISWFAENAVSHDRLPDYRPFLQSRQKGYRPKNNNSGLYNRCSPEYGRRSPQP